MPMLCFFTIFAVVALGLLWRVRACVRWESDGNVIGVCIRLHFFYALLSVRIYRSFHLRETESLASVLEKDRLLRAVVKKTGQRDKRTKRPSLAHVKKIVCHTYIGVRDDACATALCAGFVQALFDAIGAAVSHEFSGYVEPVFNAGLFRIKLEGIIDFYPAQIMSAGIKRQVSKIRGKQYAASD